jgi:3-deoxy-D-manno-octulosonic-acid transferase
MVPRGGHNVLEPAARGAAVVVGPHTEHIREAVDGLVGAGGILCLTDAEDLTLVDALEKLLTDESLRNQLATRAREFCLGCAGAAAQSVHALIGCVERQTNAITARGLPRVTPETGRLVASAAASSAAGATPRRDW